MSLDVVVEVLTGEQTNSVPKEVTIEGKPAMLVSGFVYLRNISSNGFLLQQITTADVVYERLDNKRLYRVNAPLVEVQKSQISSDSGDLRYLLFGSRKLYKAFLDLLNKEYKSDEEFFTIFQKINSRLNEMYVVLGSACVLLKRKVLRDYRKELEQDSLIGPYIEKAKSYLRE